MIASDSDSDSRGDRIGGVADRHGCPTALTPEGTYLQGKGLGKVMDRISGIKDVENEIQVEVERVGQTHLSLCGGVFTPGPRRGGPSDGKDPQTQPKTVYRKEIVVRLFRIHVQDGIVINKYNRYLNQ